MTYSAKELELERRLRSMPVDTPEEARAYLTVFDEYRAAAWPYGMLLTAHWKPASVRAPDLFAKASRATETAGLCYWQMPFEEAERRFFGLPREKWERERLARGFALEPGS